MLSELTAKGEWQNPAEFEHLGQQISEVAEEENEQRFNRPNVVGEAREEGRD